MTAMIGPFAVVEKAGLKKIDFAEIIGVSRATVTFWFRGDFAPKGEKQAKVDYALRILAASVASGKLPHEDQSDEKRRSIVAKIKSKIEQ